MPRFGGRGRNPEDGRSRVPGQTLGNLGDANVQPRGLGVGTTAPGTDVGRSNAVYAVVDLTNVPDLLNVTVSHRLGQRPTICELIETSNAGASAFAQARPVNKHLWTPTACRVAVSMTVGTQAGTVLKFRVGGE